MKPRNYDREYRNYQGTEKQKKERALRNKARRSAEKEGRVHKGDGKDVHHVDGNPRSSKTHVRDKKDNRSFRRRSDHTEIIERIERLLEKTIHKGDYMIRPLSLWEYEVTKWTHGKAPEERYIVNVKMSKRGVRTVEMTCTCPQYSQRRKPCKHMALVKEYVKKDKGMDTSHLKRELEALGL